MRYFGALNLFLLLGQALAAPTPQDQSTTPATGGSLSDLTSLLPQRSAEETCNSYGAHNSAVSDADKWKESGAGPFLESFLKAHGSAQWVNSMDRLVNGIPVATDLNCGNLGAQGCSALGARECSTSNPAAYWFIRKATNNVHDYLAQYRNELNGDTIKQILKLEKLIQDFATDPATTDIDVAGLVLGMFTPLLNMVGVPIGDMLENAIDVANSVYSTAKSGIDAGLQVKAGDKLTDVRLRLNDGLSNMFTQARDHTRDLANAVFGIGKDETSKAIYRSMSTSFGGSEDAPTAIANYFAKGQHLPEIHLDKITEDMAARGKLTEQALISGILKAQDHFVFVDTNLKTRERCEGDEFKGSWRNYDGQGDKCWTIQVVAKWNAFDWSNPMSKERFAALDAYGISRDNIYQNSYECQLHTKAAEGNTDTMDAAEIMRHTDPNTLPRCTFTLPVIFGHGRPCVRQGDHEWHSRQYMEREFPANLWKEWEKNGCWYA